MVEEKWNRVLDDIAPRHEMIKFILVERDIGDKNRYRQNFRAIRYIDSYIEEQMETPTQPQALNTLAKVSSHKASQDFCSTLLSIVAR